MDLFDLDRLIRYLGTRLDWEAVWKIGADFHWLPALAAALPGCVELLGTPIPPWIIQGTAAYRLPSSERWVLNRWLGPGRIKGRRTLLDWLMFPGQVAKVRILFSFLFPGRTYMQAQYGEHTVWQLPFLYMRRLWRETDFK